MTCSRSGADCVYEDQVTRITVTEKEWNDLQARAEAAESVRASLTPSVTEEGSSREHEGEDDWWFKDREILIVSRSGGHRVVGAASAMYLATQLNPESRSHVAFDISPLHHAKLPLRREIKPSIPDLPPFETAKRWYAAQFAYIGSIFAFIQPKYFEDRLTEVYSRPPDTSKRDDCLLYCQILLILSFGQMYSLNEWASNDGPPGFAYFQAALKLLPDIHEEGSVLFVEVLGLVSYFMQILNRRDAAFLYIGLAVRMAISLGMHQEVTNSDMDEVELEHRRRAWWSVYSMDRVLSVKAGNPISIQDEDIEANWPSPLPALDVDPAHPKILAHYTKLSRVLGRVGEGIYRQRHKSGSTLLATIQSIFGDLEQWLRDIPPELKLDFSNIRYQVSREAVSSFLHYYQVMNMTGRPLLFRVCQKRLEALKSGNATDTWQEGLSSNVVHIVSNCIAAARSATVVMDAASKHNLLATFGFMDGEHIFSAALVLVMANVAFPHNERDYVSMHQALSILKGMANRGNEYIRARHALLLNLRDALGRRSWQEAGARSEYELVTQHSIETDTYPVYEQFEGLPFNIDMEDQDSVWDELSNQAFFGMNSEWMADAFQHATREEPP